MLWTQSEVVLVQLHAVTPYDTVSVMSSSATNEENFVFILSTLVPIIWRTLTPHASGYLIAEGIQQQKGHEKKRGKGEGVLVEIIPRVPTTMRGIPSVAVTLSVD